MFLSRILLRIPPNTVDQIPYYITNRPREPSKLKRLNRTRRNDLPVEPEQVQTVRAQLDTEYWVMRCLATPYLSTEQENVWHKNHGTPAQNVQKEIEEFEQTRMPGKVKSVTTNKRVDKQRGNIGNLLHKHRTIDDQLSYLYEQRRFDG